MDHAGAALTSRRAAERRSPRWRDGRGPGGDRGWWPNVRGSPESLRPRGAHVVAAADTPSLPFTDASFDLVVSRHPVVILWGEIAGCCGRAGCTFRSRSGRAPTASTPNFMMGPKPVNQARSAANVRRSAELAGLEVVDLREARPARRLLRRRRRRPTSCARCCGRFRASPRRPDGPQLQRIHQHIEEGGTVRDDGDGDFWSRHVVRPRV